MSNPTDPVEQPSSPSRDEGYAADVPDNKVTIERQRFLELVEVDLWGKFQKRLWAVITGFLVLVSVAGFLGVPYYIEVRTSAIFSEQSKKYEEEVRRTTSYLKSYLLLTSKYEEFHQRLRQDIYVVLLDLADFYEANPDISSHFGPEDMLLKVLHEDDPRVLVEQNSIFRSYFSDSLDELKLSINERIHLENTIFGATGSTSAPHPYRNGELEGFVEDLRLKILILAAFMDALEAQQEIIFQIGGETDLEKRIRRLEVEAISNTEFLPNFDNYLSSNAEKIRFSHNGFAEPQEVFKFYLEVLNFDPSLLPSIGGLKMLQEPEIDVDTTKADSTENATRVP